MAAIPAERCIAGRDLTEPRLTPDGRAVVYAASAAGVAALVLHPLDGSPERQLTAYPPPRPGRGLGGGCWCFLPDGHALVYVGDDGNLWLQPLPGGAVRRLTDHGPDRAASAPSATPDGRQVLYVVDQAEVWRIDVATGSADPGAANRLDDGSADFCLDPCVSPDGSTAVWMAWSVPDMPWDRARIERVALADGHRLPPVEPHGSVQQPRVAPDGALWTVRDDTGWLNVWRGEGPVVDEPFEHAGPTWGAGQRSYALSPDGRRLAFTRNERGFGRLCVADLGTGAVTEVARGVHGQLDWRGGSLVALRTGARTPTCVVRYDTATWERTVVAVGPVSGWEDEPLAEPELVEAPAPGGGPGGGPVGGVVHARLYRADRPTARLLCWLHGGPTDQWQVTFMPRLAYWRSRGWNVLVPDHRGSTGHGRAYQQALRGRWGELDVADSIAAVRHAHAMGWGDPAHTVVTGGSAGGFTALGVAAAEPALLAAAVVSYPVTDLADLAERSHRFERHYTHSLVGPLPAAADLHAARSPIGFAHRFAGVPVLVLHGDSDPVVPVEQSTVFAERARAAGADVELHVYEGEGHGFRRPENQLDEYRRIEDFLTRHVPAG